MNKVKCKLISDFNIDNLAGYLNNNEMFSHIEAVITPYNQVIQSLMNADINDKKEASDITLCWTQPQSISLSFARVVQFEDIDHNQAVKEVDAFCDILVGTKKNQQLLLVPMWVMPTYFRGYGLLDMKDGLGVANLLNKMNGRLAENLKDHKSIYILNIQKWINRCGSNAFSPKLWYMAKMAFSNDVFIEAAREIAQFCEMLNGQARKLIIVDLDDTLWGGIIGDEGLEQIRLGGHDFIGEAFVDFQKTIKSLTNKGIILGIVSKNEESIALEAIRKHPEMVLREEDFAGWKINWLDKVKNIEELVSELNLGLQSVVFIDDNPVERDRVKAALPEVYVPDWPKDKTLYASTLSEMRCFDTLSITDEDLQRKGMYRSEKKRKDLKASVQSYDKWLKNLQTKIMVAELQDSNIKRTVQLLNKTNQMNLSTRRLSEGDLKDWCLDKQNNLWVLRVSDKFGDSGLVGIISLVCRQNEAQILDFVLSCRVMGRKIEEAMVNLLWKFARDAQCNQLWAEFIQTAKNMPCFDFWQKSGFVFQSDSNRFIWDMNYEYQRPSSIKIESTLL